MWGRQMLGLATVAPARLWTEADDGEACRASSDCAGNRCVYGIAEEGAAFSHRALRELPCPAGWKCGMIHGTASPKHVDLVCRPIPAKRPVPPTTQQNMSLLGEDDPLDLEKLRNGPGRQVPSRDRCRSRRRSVMRLMISVEQLHDAGLTRGAGGCGLVSESKRQPQRGR